MNAGTGRRKKHARKRQMRDYMFQWLLPINWFSCNSHPLEQDSFINIVKRLDCVMADLLKNTTEKKNTKMVIISTSCFSLSQWAFSHLIIPATISALLHVLKTKEISSPHWWSWFNSLFSVTSSVKTPNMVQAATETNPKALLVLLCRGVSRMSCCGTLI